MLALHVQPTVVEDQEHSDATQLVGCSLKLKLRALLELVFAKAESHHANVFCGHQNHLASVENTSVVTCSLVDVSLCNVVQLVHICLQNGI